MNIKRLRFILDGKFYFNRTKYMPGDLVKFKGNFYEIMEASEYSVKIWYLGGKKPKVLQVRADDVTPIPLTIEIFLVNQWKLYKRTDEGEILRYHEIFVVRDNNGRFYYKTNDGKVYLNCVSDLQHLMFAFKMDY